MSQFLRNLVRFSALAFVAVAALGRAACSNLRVPRHSHPAIRSASRAFTISPRSGVHQRHALYEDGQYDRAEVMFKRALADGLRDRNDIAAANKHLAFIACAYSRPAECESAFRAAFSADPSSG